MLKKMRWRFICSAMAAITAVVLVLVGGLNLWNYRQTTQWQDDVLQRLWEQEQTAAQGRQEEPSLPGQPAQRLEGYGHQGERQNRSDRDLSMPGPFGGHNPEFRYMLRFFTVRCNQAGAPVETDREFIASVSKEDAFAWAEKVLQAGKSSGYFNDYRYRSEMGEDGPVVLFLNATREIQSVRSLLLTSVVVALASLLAVFVLVVLFSRRAIAPYVRNIEVQKRFITDAGHELKTPLTAISASADILADDLPDNEWVTAIQTECVRMTRLVGDLVTLSRLDEEQPFPERTDFSLSDVVWEIAEPVQSLAKAKGKCYEQTIEDGLVCHGDRQAIQQMVSILLDNALKYSPEYGAIRLDVGKVKGRLQLQVFNTCDVAGLDVSRLFDRFYRPDVSRASHTGGTGIGLSIARATALAHGGDISARAEADGITFTVRL